MESPADSGGVLALVLTHSAPASLRTCVDAVLAQTRPPDHVIVVDNAGTPPAASVLPEDPRVEVMRLDTNTGPAGGHAFGLARFLERGSAWAWVMDDDVIAAPDCLERLLAAAAADHERAFLWPSSRDHHGDLLGNPGWLGVLLARHVVDAVGLPIADLVWWTEDTEYLQRRIPYAGFPALGVAGAFVAHDNARDEPTTPPWKVYYQVRNTVYYRVHIQHWSHHPVRLLRSLLRSLGGALIPAGPRGARLRQYVHGLVDGTRGRLGLRVPLPS